ncbi:hypothetical protein IW261DRAFT_1643554 [Armillaria novae-zelandiae]|uniref:Uncharacterized protein n=1 Tax=Armillaria novae-zelandiae TaxID=153914 RepID=A0AA39P240_9AGAR|nr:hypothetical protein IW261DRAFT_1643554 [Armillaria novae-zelandiae]
MSNPCKAGEYTPLNFIHTSQIIKITTEKNTTHRVSPFLNSPTLPRGTDLAQELRHRCYSISPVIVAPQIQEKSRHYSGVVATLKPLPARGSPWPGTLFSLQYYLDFEKLKSGIVIPRPAYLLSLSNPSLAVVQSLHMEILPGKIMQADEIRLGGVDVFHNGPAAFVEQAYQLRSHFRVRRIDSKPYDPRSSAMSGHLMLITNDRVKKAENIPRILSIKLQVSEKAYPTLYVSSLQDEVQEVAVLPWLMQVPKIERVELANSSHLGMYEEEDRYLRILKGFLEAT